MIDGQPLKHLGLSFAHNTRNILWMNQTPFSFELFSKSHQYHFQEWKSDDDWKDIWEDVPSIDWTCLLNNWSGKFWNVSIVVHEAKWLRTIIWEFYCAAVCKMTWKGDYSGNFYFCFQVLFHKNRGKDSLPCSILAIFTGSFFSTSHWKKNLR